MKNKPLIFSVLSVLCFVEPLIKILYFKATTHFDFSIILMNLWAKNSFLDVIDFWLIFPMAGALIWKLRKWSYYSFLGVLAYINYNIFTYEKYTWPYNSDSPFMYNYVVAVMSVAVFLFFLSPRVREPFFDRRVRWWEPKTRYDVSIMCKMMGKNLTFPSTILNMSQSGAFVAESKYMKVGDILEMEFNFLSQTITLPVEVMNKHEIRGVVGYGLKFNFRTYRQNVLMTKVTNILRRSQREFQEPDKVAA